MQWRSTSSSSLWGTNGPLDVGNEYSDKRALGALRREARPFFNEAGFVILDQGSLQRALLFSVRVLQHIGHDRAPVGSAAISHQLSAKRTPAKGPFFQISSHGCRASWNKSVNDSGSSWSSSNFIISPVSDTFKTDTFTRACPVSATAGPRRMGASRISCRRSFVVFMSSAVVRYVHRPQLVANILTHAQAIASNALEAGGSARSTP